MASCPSNIHIARRAAQGRARRRHAEIPGGQWLDPEQVFAWKDEIARDRPAVLYCAKGHEISQGIAATLQALGLNARYLVDGYVGWRAAQMPVNRLATDKEEPT